MTAIQQGVLFDEPWTPVQALLTQRLAQADGSRWLHEAAQAATPAARPAWRACLLALWARRLEWMGQHPHSRGVDAQGGQALWAHPLVATRWQRLAQCMGPQDWARVRQRLSVARRGRVQANALPI